MVPYFYYREALGTLLSLQGAAFITKGTMGSGGWRVMAKACESTSFRTTQYPVSDCLFNGAKPVWPRG